MQLSQRPRRLREHAILRDAIVDVDVRKNHLMLPLFIADIPEAKDIPAMPGIKQHNPISLVKSLEPLIKNGLRMFILFGTPKEKDPLAKAAYSPNSIVSQTLQLLRKQYGQDIYLATDVCLCAYTDHGHCGVIEHDRIDNDKSVELLAKMALVHAQAGANMVAPSDMMDGRIQGIRSLLDEHGMTHTALMSYCIKYASSFYGPFRYAADSTPAFGDRKTYQMDFRRQDEVERQATLDLEQGADILMVKPAQSYLDIVYRLRAMSPAPLAVYQVSGEYAMIKYAAEKGALDEQKAVIESWTAFRRAGANIILTYYAEKALLEQWLN